MALQLSLEYNRMNFRLMACRRENALVLHYVYWNFHQHILTCSYIVSKSNLRSGTNHSFQIKWAKWAFQRIDFALKFKTFFFFRFFYSNDVFYIAFCNFFLQ